MFDLIKKSLLVSLGAAIVTKERIDKAKAQKDIDYLRAKAALDRAMHRLRITGEKA